jgi:hypothetical protein
LQMDEPPESPPFKLDDCLIWMQRARDHAEKLCRCFPPSNVSGNPPRPPRRRRVQLEGYASNYACRCARKFRPALPLRMSPGAGASNNRRHGKARALIESDRGPEAECPAFRPFQQVLSQPGGCRRLRSGARRWDPPAPSPAPARGSCRLGQRSSKRLRTGVSQICHTCQDSFMGAPHSSAFGTTYLLQRLISQWFHCLHPRSGGSCMINRPVARSEAQAGLCRS